MNDANLQALGHRVRAAREAADMSVSGLAARVGAHRAYIDRVEKGERRPSAEWLQKIAEALDIEPIELLVHIGVRPASTLPKPRDYFLRALGATEEEADFLDHLVEYELSKRREEPRAETDQERHGKTD